MYMFWLNAPSKISEEGGGAKKMEANASEKGNKMGECGQFYGFLGFFFASH